MKHILLALALLFAPMAAHAQIVGSFPYTFTNGTTADANQVMANYNYLKTAVNNGALPLTGGVLTGGLSGTTLALSSLETVGGSLTVTGATTLNSTLNVVGASTLAATGVVGGLTTDTLAVSSTSTFTGVLTASGGVTGNASTATILQTARNIGTSGDTVCTAQSFNGSAAITMPCTFATVNANVGTFGTSTVVPQITFNAKGLATAVTTNAIPIADNVGTTGLTTLATNAQTIAGADTTHAMTPASNAAQLFESPPILIIYSTAGTLAHGLGVKPKRIQAFIRNATAECGHVPNDEVPVNVYYESSWRGAQGFIQGTAYVGYTIATAIEILNGSTGAGCLITAYNWTLVIRAWAN